MLGDTSSKGRSSVSSSSCGLFRVLSCRENESLYRALIASLNYDIFLISVSRAHSYGMRCRIVLRGTVCTFCFRTHWVISFPSFLAGPRQRPSTWARHGNFAFVSQKYTHSYNPNWQIFEMSTSSPNVAKCGVCPCSWNKYLVVMLVIAALLSAQ